MESPLSAEHILSQERVHCAIGVAWDVSGSQQLESLLTPEEDMAVKM